MIEMGKPLLKCFLLPVKYDLTKNFWSTYSGFQTATSSFFSEIVKNTIVWTPFETGSPYTARFLDMLASADAFDKVSKSIDDMRKKNVAENKKWENKHEKLAQKQERENHVVEEAKKRLQELVHKKDARNLRKKQQDDELNSLETKRNGLQNTRNQLQRTMEEKEAVVEQLRQTASNDSDQLRQKGTEITTLEHQLQLRKGQIQMKEKEQQVLCSNGGCECNTCGQSISKTLRDTLESKVCAEIEMFENECTGLDTRIKLLKSEHSKLEAHRNETLQTAKNAEREEKEAQQSITQKDREIHQLEKDLAILRGAIQTHDEYQRTDEGEIDEYHKKITSQEEELKNTTAEIETCDAYIGQKKIAIERNEKMVSACAWGKSKMLQSSRVLLCNRITVWLENLFNSRSLANTNDRGCHVLQVCPSDDVTSAEPELSWNDGMKTSINCLSTGEYYRYRLATFLGFCDVVRELAPFSCNLVLLDECFLGMDTFGVLDILFELKTYADACKKSVFVSSISRYDHLNIRPDRVILLRAEGDRTTREDNWQENTKKIETKAKKRTEPSRKRPPPP
eukprot:m.751256 g.751256  ORF g.751256 m.751256 type:complete len:566 (+) comp23166_c0_seq2:1270-2967(+)